ncbi:shikimate dehydrogenase [Nocardioides pacificus]
MTTRCAVLGDPIAHSLSPVLHRAGYAVLGLDWEYDACRVAEDGLVAFLGGLDPTWRGLSLTMPLKRTAIALADEVSARGRLAGAVNTLVLGERVFGDNTDIPGAAAAVRERWDGDVSTVTVLGGGATATSTALAMCDLGARAIRLLVRSPERAAETVAAVSAHPSAPRVEVGDLAAASVLGEVVVSTIPASAQTPELVARCADVPVVFEVIYDPWPTPLAASAADRTLVGGLDLLVHQAVVQFELFTGQAAPLDAMRAAGAAALAAR